MKNPLRWLSPGRDRARPVEHRTEQKMASGLSSLFAMAPVDGATWSGTDYGSLARVGFMQNPVVHRCVRLIAQTASAIPLLVYENARELDEHPLLALISHPNPQQSGAAFLESLIGHLLISGNAYVERLSVDDTPRELVLLRPDRMRVLTDRNGWVDGYEYAARGGNRVQRMASDGTCPVLHIGLFHPLDDHYGFPPLRSALMALDVHNAASRWNKALLDNSARPSGALVYAAGDHSNLSDDQFDRLKKELEDGYTGSSRAGRPLLLEGGLDWKAMGFSPRDMDFAAGRDAAARDIALAFGVPPMLLGIPGDNTYSNYQEANRALVRQTVLPMINRIIDSINHWMQPAFGTDIRLAIDEDCIEGLAAERETVWSRLSAAEFLSDDEKRQAVGYSPRSDDQ